MFDSESLRAEKHWGSERIMKILLNE